MREHTCPLEVQLSVVLEREAHPAQYLDGRGGARLGRLAGHQQRAQRMEVCVAAPLVAGDGGKHRLCEGKLGLHCHLGARVLDRLVHADRLAELHPVDRVPCGDVANRLGDTCQHRRREHLTPPLDRVDVARHRRDRLHVVGPRPVQGRGRIEAAHFPDVAERANFHQRGAFRREHQRERLSCVEQADLAVERAAERQAHPLAPTDDRGSQIVPAAEHGHPGREDRRQKRAARQRPADLSKQQRLVGQAEAHATASLGQTERKPAELGGLRPRRRVDLVTGVEQLTRARHRQPSP